MNMVSELREEDNRVKQEIGMKHRISHSSDSNSTSQPEYHLSVEEARDSDICFKNKREYIHFSNKNECSNAGKCDLKTELREKKEICMSDNDSINLDTEMNFTFESQGSEEPNILNSINSKLNLLKVTNNEVKSRAYSKYLNSSKYHCSYCSKPFINKAHMMTHTDEKPYICHVCGVAFTRCSNLTRHSLCHTRVDSKQFKIGRFKSNVTTFECAICLKIFKRKPYLIEHLMSHSGEKPYKCQVCSVQFRRHSNLVRLIKCHCENDYLTGQHLNRGRRRNNAIKEQYTCDVCCKVFKVSSHLKTHMMTHTGEKPFMCHICGQFFARHTNMLRHTRLHTQGNYQAGEIPRRGRRKNDSLYECHMCSKSFQHMSRWQEHLMSHTGEKPHMCDVYGKFFARRTNLLRHTKIHAGTTSAATNCLRFSGMNS